MWAPPLINAFVTLAGAQGSYCLAQTSGNNNNNEENEIKKIWRWTSKKTRQKQVGFINSCLKNIRSLAGFLSLVNVLGQVVLFSFPLLVILPSAACDMNYQPLSCHYLAASCFLSSGRARSSWTSHPSCTITQQRKVHARVRVLLDLKVVALKPLHHVIFNTVCQRWNWVMHTRGRLKTKPERSSLKPLIHHRTASYWVGPEFMSKYETGYVGKMALKKRDIMYMYKMKMKLFSNCSWQEKFLFCSFTSRRWQVHSRCYFYDKVLEFSLFCFTVDFFVCVEVLCSALRFHRMLFDISLWMRTIQLN